MSGNNPLRYLYDKDGGGWFGYRGLFAVIFASAQFGLFAYWVTYTGVALSAGMFYLTLIPFVFGILFTGFLPGKSGITPKTFLIFAVWGVLAYALYDWVRVPMNLMVGVPFWDHWFDWGARYSRKSRIDDIYLWKSYCRTRSSHTPRMGICNGLLSFSEKGNSILCFYICFFSDNLLLGCLSCICFN